MSSRGGRLSKMVVVMTTAQCIEEKYIRFLALRRREWIRVEDRRKGSRSKVQEQKLERGKVSKSGKKGKKRIPRCPPFPQRGSATLLSSFFQSLSLRTIHPHPFRGIYPTTCRITISNRDLLFFEGINLSRLGNKVGIIIFILYISWSIYNIYPPIYMIKFIHDFIYVKYSGQNIEKNNKQ